MAFLTLRDIGKIYVSEGNVSVGIRGINLSFELGEFVAVTGESGSGKSTLLNVLSGMDSYEEGELFIEGNPTSHYLPEDWEEYREKYISFIFQDYNIIDSFTVLQNVELALLHIENPRERRARAVELLRRVGLEKHLHHRGSRLSGGQKQRTVIARALAKDSPVILADEPTGNLDSRTSKEIIELLREVSAGKLVIVVTHSFDELEGCATRHIRIYDGGVESDRYLAPAAAAPAEDDGKAQVCAPDKAKGGEKKKSILRQLYNGLMLGAVRFRARPKLSLFMCAVMLIAVLMVTGITAGQSGISTLPQKNYLFTHKDGRVVVARNDGKPLDESELSRIATDTGADDMMRIDYLMDVKLRGYTVDIIDEGTRADVGRLPQNAGEVLAEVPLRDKDMSLNDLALYDGLLDTPNIQLVGAVYRVDNTIEPRLLMTREGYEEMKWYLYMLDRTNQFSAFFPDDGSFEFPTPVNFMVSRELEAGTFAVINPQYLGNADRDSFMLQAKLSVSNYGGGDYYYTDVVAIDTVVPETSDSVTVTRIFEGFTQVEVPSGIMYDEHQSATLVLSIHDVGTFVTEDCFDKVYIQSSLFYGSDRAAGKAVKELRDMGYVAVPSYTSIKADQGEMLANLILGFVKIVSWLIGLAFIALFLGLCTSRSMLAGAGEIATMRSMGIPVRVIRLSVYFQSAIAFVAAIPLAAAAFTAIYLVPETNSMFVFLHTGDYIGIFVGMMIVVALLSRRYTKRLFKESVKKTLRGETF